jgi:Leucine-rich repeat (LRR) protein
MLYLNNNDFLKIPTEIKDLKNLKYLDIHDNKIAPSNYQNFQNRNFGIKINF